MATLPPPKGSVWDAIGALGSIIRELPGSTLRERLVADQESLSLEYRLGLPRIVFVNITGEASKCLPAALSDSGRMAWASIACPLATIGAQETQGLRLRVFDGANNAPTPLTGEPRFVVQIRGAEECADAAPQSENGLPVLATLALGGVSQSGVILEIASEDNSSAQEVFAELNILSNARDLMQDHILARLRELLIAAVAGIGQQTAVCKDRLNELARQKRFFDESGKAFPAKDQALQIRALLKNWRQQSEERVRAAVAQNLRLDARLISSLLTIDDFVMKEQVSAIREKLAQSKNPLLRAVDSLAGRSISRRYLLSVSPAAEKRIAQHIRQRVLDGIGGRHELGLTGEVNSAVGQLFQVIRAEAPLFSAFSGLIDRLRPSTLPPSALTPADHFFDYHLDVEERFNKAGFFKHLAAGRMVANMSFSFLVMLAGGFVFLFEDLKAHLRKFSFVVVFLMFAITLISLAFEADEEAKELEEKLEKIRQAATDAADRLYTSAASHIEKAAMSELTALNDKLEGAIEDYLASIQDQRTAAAEARKDDDDYARGLLQRRQTSFAGCGQKFVQLQTSLDRLVTAAPARPRTTTTTLASTRAETSAASRV